MCVALTGVLALLAACHSGLLVTLKPEEQTLPLCVWIGSGAGDTDASDGSVCSHVAVPQGTERHLRPWDRALIQSVAGTGPHSAGFMNVSEEKALSIHETLCHQVPVQVCQCEAFLTLNIPV